MPGIDLHDTCVDFPIFNAKSRSLKKAMLGLAPRRLSPLSKTGGKIGTDHRIPIIEALNGMTISLREGDRLGLVGHNGAGKSTLLRVMAGIYEPTRGTARISGSVAPVFDLGVGMDPEISGYENIIIRGLFLGMTRKQMQARVGDIAEFTELGDYLSMPLRTYSTGMRVRLALGVVTCIDPEILLLDEGIGAVDASFLDKARDRLHDLVRRSGILVFASHSDDLLVEWCSTAIWLEEGRLRELGTARDVIDHYSGRLPAAVCAVTDHPNVRRRSDA
ncbi:MAG: galactan export ABC transporter ATP-binding subunit Wzt/RfbE [Pseudonocardiaceae bacterium]